MDKAQWHKNGRRFFYDGHDIHANQPGQQTIRRPCPPGQWSNVVAVGLAYGFGLWVLFVII
jgi:hypothetical protein